MVNNIKRKKAKKQLILDAATRIFIKKGYKKTSIAEIAKEAQSSQVTLYKYFSSKVELARGVVVEMIIDGYDESKSFLDNPNKTFVEKMHQLMTYGMDTSRAISDDFVIFMYDEFSGKNGNTNVMKAYNDYKYGFWKQLLDQGRTEGVINSKITDEGAIIYLDMLINYAMSPNQPNGHTAVEVKNHEDDLIQLFFYGIMGR